MDAVREDARMSARSRADASEDDDPTGGLSGRATRTLAVAENVVYGGIATLLVGTALVCLALARSANPTRERFPAGAGASGQLIG